MSIVLSPYNSLDFDAVDYIKRVETADQEPLEYGVKQAINQFVVGCKQDGIWNAIQASCIIAGARTLNGSLVPLVGTPPTNFNFVNADYNRKTGLRADNNKALNTNTTGNNYLQNNNHFCAYITNFYAPQSTVQTILGNINDGGSTRISLAYASGFVFVPANYCPDAISNITNNTNFGGISSGFIGMARNLSSNYRVRNGGATQTFSGISGTLSSPNTNLWVNARPTTLNNPTQFLLSPARTLFYSMGKYLDISLLDARITTLINTINFVVQ